MVISSMEASVRRSAPRFEKSPCGSPVSEDTPKRQVSMRACAASCRSWSHAKPSCAAGTQITENASANANRTQMAAGSARIAPRAGNCAGRRSIKSPQTSAAMQISGAAMPMSASSRNSASAINQPINAARTRTIQMQIGASSTESAYSAAGRASSDAARRGRL